MEKRHSYHLRKGDKAWYEVPGFLQGLYLEATIPPFIRLATNKAPVFFAGGATFMDMGLGLSFFDDNVKIQFNYGFLTQNLYEKLGGAEATEAMPITVRYGGHVLGLKILANVYTLPFYTLFGPDFEWLKASFALGANFSLFDIGRQNYTQSGNPTWMGALIGQLEFPKVTSDNIRNPPWTGTPAGTALGTFATGNRQENRQAIQPLQTGIRIDCRTPTATPQYRIRRSVDTVSTLIMRDIAGFSNAGNLAENRRLPITDGNANDKPQSSEHLTGRRANWGGMDAWTNQTTYTIGSDDYNDGGMIVYINAWVMNGTNRIDAYEAAYRSVFVFNNAPLNNNNSNFHRGTATDPMQPMNIGTDGPASQTDGILPNQKLGRMWVRGGNNTTNDPTIPDFPISRDRTAWRKARLLTPIQVANDDFTAANNYKKTLTDANIPNHFK